MDVEHIKSQIKSITDTSSIYLLEALTETTGFFANDGRLLYISITTIKIFAPTELFFI